MKTRYFTLCMLCIYTLSSFTFNSKACDYAGSNIGYVKSQTQRAIEAEDINSARFFAYKALNAIEKSKKQFEACGCDYAVKSIYEGLDNLKKATRISSLNGTKILLRRALENALGSLEALEEHDELHNGPYASDVLALNTKASEEAKLIMKQPVGPALQKRIDMSLLNYEKSLNTVVLTVECKEAYAFAIKIYKNCEEQLLKADLTEAKKYYNLRTKEITAEALAKLQACSN